EAPATNPGRCFIEQVGVNAPGTAKSTTRLPRMISPIVTSLGPLSPISLTLTSSGRVSPTLTAISFSFSAALEGRVDHLLEAVHRTILEPLAIDEEGRRPLHVRGSSLRHLPVDLLLHLRRGDVLLPARHVEAGLACIFLELVAAELARIFEEHVVELPE